MNSLVGRSKVISSLRAIIKRLSVIFHNGNPIPTAVTAWHDFECRPPFMMTFCYYNLWSWVLCLPSIDVDCWMKEPSTLSYHCRVMKRVGGDRGLGKRTSAGWTALDVRGGLPMHTRLRRTCPVSGGHHSRGWKGVCGGGGSSESITYRWAASPRAE